MAGSSSKSRIGVNQIQFLMRDIRQTPEYANYLRSTGWKVETINSVNYFIKKLPILGNVIKIQRPEVLKHKDIKKLKEKFKPFQIIFEPKNSEQEKEILNIGFRLKKSYYLPTKTLHLDLNSSMIRIIKAAKKDAKRAIQKTQNLSLSIHTKDTLRDFKSSWTKAVGWRRSVPNMKNLTALKKAFGEKCIFLSINSIDSDHRSKVIAGGIFLLADKKGYYWSAYTSKEGRQKLAQYKIVWEGIKWAKGRGAKTFDFEGIYDKRFPIKSWKGFSHFKKSFGGYEVKYPGTFTKYFFLRNY